MSNIVRLRGYIPHAMPVDIVVAAHLRHLELLGRQPGHIYGRARALARMTAALGKPLLDVTAADLTEWRAGLRAGPDTVATYLSHARSFYTWAVDGGLIESSPAARLPGPKRSRRKARPIGEEDLAAALAAAPDRIRPWLVLAGWCGLRAVEIALLRRENVLDTAQPPTLLIAWDATKGRTERVLPISSFVLGELRAAGLPASGYVFRRRDGGRGPNHPHQLSHLANDYLHSLGIAATLHQLRHRYATKMYELTLNPALVQELLGHRDPASTAIYVQVVTITTQALAAVEALPVPGRLRAVGQ